MTGPTPQIKLDRNIERALQRAVSKQMHKAGFYKKVTAQLETFAMDHFTISFKLEDLHAPKI